MSLPNIATKIIVLMLALAGAGPLWAADRDRDRFISEPMDTNPNARDLDPWKEQGGVTLPPWPQDSDLVEFRVSDPRSSLRHFIDTKSLSVDAQKVVRYTVVVESGSGARNVAYEGIRCTPTGQHRTYAYGTSGKFVPVPDAPWTGVLDSTVPRYARDLQRLFLCVPLKFEPRPVKEMPRILSGHGNPRDQSGFLTD